MAHKTPNIPSGGIIMGIEKLIQAIAIVVLLTFAAGNLRPLVFQIRKAQFNLIQASKTESWGTAILLKN
jgi:hypothetical protein